MAKAKKFGTFGGVFTPSILTILGVIMYLRFPAIIGQAGLLNTIAIIVIAHVISITTSLSVASLSTDKPVQNGGTYFMISRSLGLPIGGTLGLALFVGLSFSVSLYLIGFAESFLQYWDMDMSINSIRIAGSIVLFAVTTITFISTSLAIKSQYFIMAAIGLSLLSIFFGTHEFAPKEINWAPMATSAPFMVLFGIFFPAVTGFEAGVSMSGDLQDAKKSLPVGAMLAVGVGFVVYLGLAFFYAYTVDSDAMVNDPQILFKISAVPSLVIAGIWGATLSSALGSILGAPRILQAIAQDKIAPAMFAKGTGATNEPRNALLLAFVIAEIGILIGDLDVIARIVSMFFITTYAFLNMASAIESWSSSDYRPAFKTPRFVSILGAVSAFIVMVLLDFIALAGATFTLGLLYFYLQRKELILESGDAWSSFWTNLAKRALLKLSGQKTNTRNWRPNIILFSGGEKARPYLVEMGLALSGKLGALTDFNLVSIGDSTNAIKPLISKREKDTPNYFSRQFVCNNVEAGIESVTSVYGFSGFEPNTVLMGWSKDTKNVSFLVKVLKDFKNKNLNAVFVDYDKNVGFGKKEHIDIWWNGKGRHLSFSLNILRFLQSDPAWRDAQVRILIINNESSLTERIYRNTAALLTEKRMKAEIKILSDDFGSRSKEAIINSESASADLILIGLSQRNNAYTHQYVESINNISELPASLLILNPSDEFEVINVVDAPFEKTTEDTLATPLPALQALPAMENKVIQGRLEKLESDWLSLGSQFHNAVINQTVKHSLQLLKNIAEFARTNKLQLEREMREQPNSDITKILIRNQQLFLRHAHSITSQKNKAIIDEVTLNLKSGLSGFTAKVRNYLHELPDEILISFTSGKDSKVQEYDIQLQKIVSFFFQTTLMPEAERQLDTLETMSVELFAGIRKNIFGINDAYEKLLLQPKAENVSVFLENKEFEQQFTTIETQLKDLAILSATSFQSVTRQIILALSKDFASRENLKQLEKKTRVKTTTSIEYLDNFGENWGIGIQLINNTLLLDTRMLSEQKIIKNIVQKSNDKTRILLSEQVFTHFDELIRNIQLCEDERYNEIQPLTFTDNLLLKTNYQNTFSKVSDIINNLPETITLPENIYRDSQPIKLSEYESATFNLNKVGSYYFDTLFYETFYREIEQLEQLIAKGNIACKEISSMLLFRINNTENTADNPYIDQSVSSDFFKKLSTQVTNEKAKLQNALTRNDNNSIVFLQNATSKLFYHAILESEKKISAQQRETKSRRLGDVITRKIQQAKAGINNLIVNVLNSTSSGIILSKEYLATKTEARAEVSQVLDLIESITPHKHTYEQVPIFYRTLFSSRSKINDDFWVNRKEEVQELRNAYQRHNAGLGGAILVKGVHGSGKTALTRYAASHLFTNNSVFWVNAPIEGSINTNDFLLALQRAMNSIDTVDGIFNALPFESVIVLNDLELWWERTTNGAQVIEHILDLIATYGRKVLFVLNCNTYAFNIMAKVTPLVDNLLAVVNCSNFNTKELQHLIMNRHKSSGLDLLYKGRTEEQLSQLHLTLLFNTYFSQSDGIPGAALNTWKANIIAANNEQITIQKPNEPATSELHKLDPDWLVVIALFVQHKNMDSQKLGRVLGQDHVQASKLLNNLYNAGILVVKHQACYTLGRNVEPLLVHICIEKGLI